MVYRKEKEGMPEEAVCYRYLDDIYKTFGLEENLKNDEIIFDSLTDAFNKGDIDKGKKQAEKIAPHLLEHCSELRGAYRLLSMFGCKDLQRKLIDISTHFSLDRCIFGVSNVIESSYKKEKKIKAAEGLVFSRKPVRFLEGIRDGLRDYMKAIIGIKTVLEYF